VSLTPASGHRFVLQATAARSFVGRYGVVQRLLAHRWISLTRVFLFFTRAFPVVSPTVNSRAIFRMRIGRARIRVVVPSGPGYLAAASSVRFA
jgi:hypothetical protein